MKTLMVCIKHRPTCEASCAQRGSLALVEQLEALIAQRKLPLRVHRFACLGLCELGPNVKVVGGDLFHQVGAADLPAILQAALDD